MYSSKLFLSYLTIYGLQKRCGRSIWPTFLHCFVSFSRKITLLNLSFWCTRKDWLWEFPLHVRLRPKCFTWKIMGLKEVKTSIFGTLFEMFDFSRKPTSQIWYFIFESTCCGKLPCWNGSIQFFLTHLLFSVIVWFSDPYFRSFDFLIIILYTVFLIDQKMILYVNGGMGCKKRDVFEF